jgi:hypothetical protein
MLRVVIALLGCAALGNGLLLRPSAGLGLRSARKLVAVPLRQPLRDVAPIVMKETSKEGPRAFGMAGWKAHDYFNLGMLPVLCGLTSAGLLHHAWNFPLAVVMTAYIILDGLWIAVQPSIVASPKALIGHHLITLLLLTHPLTYAPHVQLTSCMTIVEFNTFFLVLRRHAPPSKLLTLAFQLTWLVTRVLWFPIFAVWATFFAPGWQGGVVGWTRRIYVCGCICFLALLQLQWTRDALVKKPPPADDAEADGMEGFL